MKGKQQSKKSKKFSRNRITLLFVSVTLGFILAYSYNLSKDKPDGTNVGGYYYDQEEKYREELIQQQERNKQLSEELEKLQEKVLKYEESFSTSEERYSDLVKEAEDLRLLLGIIPSQGKGITITLKDGEYTKDSLNPNDYIVHESHVFKVLNELKISGAEAIAINGHRLQANSYIKCNGPVITIDDKQYPAPFVIEAVGDPSVLSSSLKISGGVFDQLIDDNIVVTIEENQKISMPAVQSHQ